MCGTELQPGELVERQHRAETQGALEEVAALQAHIDSLHGQLARMAGVVTSADSIDVHGP